MNMKLKRKRLTKSDYKQLVYYACMLWDADWLCNECLAGFYKRCILKIAGIKDNCVSPYHPLPEPRWVEGGFKQCVDLKFMDMWARIDGGLNIKLDLHHHCRKFVDWLYAECERDPSKDRDDNQKGEAK